MRVQSGVHPVAGATVRVADRTARTDVRGEARITGVPIGTVAIEVERDGFESATATAGMRSEGETVVTVRLRERVVEESVTIVSATRSDALVEDQAIRVEALPQEEIEENATLHPGDLTMLLNEIGGLRVQVVDPSLGATGLRLQGLSGRYTQILVDELPIFGVSPDVFGLLQMTPLGLARVEVVKGAVSALYGGTALGGLVNLVSARPGGEPQLLVARTLHGGTDAGGFGTWRLPDGWGVTLVGGGSWQEPRDLDADGWLEVPGYRRASIRPRLFWDEGQGRSLLLTIGGLAEDRAGGTAEGALTPDGVAYRERLETRRADAGLVGRFLVGERLIAVHASYATSRRDHLFAEDPERIVASSFAADATVAGSDHGHTWLAGLALQRERDTVAPYAGFDTAWTTPGGLVQDEYGAGGPVALAASARFDRSDRYGSFFNPRLSALFRPGHDVSIRLSAGTGAAAPTPFLDQTEAEGFSRLLPPGDLEAEHARSTSVDLGFTRGPFEMGETLFASRVDAALVVRPAASDPERFEIVNADGPTDAYGSQLFVRYHHGDLQAILSHTYLHATEKDPVAPGRRETALTPRHAAELAILWERERRGRLGIEISYTGRQALDGDPYRDHGAPYVEVAILGELRFGGESGIFVNVTNLTGVRQTRFDPLLLPERAADGRFTTDVWAPLEGRSVNLGVRLDF